VATFVKERPRYLQKILYLTRDLTGGCVACAVRLPRSHR